MLVGQILGVGYAAGNLEAVTPCWVWSKVITIRMLVNKAFLAQTSSSQTWKSLFKKVQCGSHFRGFMPEQEAIRYTAIAAKKNTWQHCNKFFQLAKWKTSPVSQRQWNPLKFLDLSCLNQILGHHYLHCSLLCKVKTKWDFVNVMAKIFLHLRPTWCIMMCKDSKVQLAWYLMFY